MNPEPEELFQLSPPSIPDEDLDQEKELLHLEGKEMISRQVLKKKWMSRNPEPSFHTLSESTSFENPFVPSVSYEAISKLLDWSMTQPEKIRELIWEFLDDPEKHLETTLQLLKEMGVVKRKRPRITHHANIKELILRNLPSTKDQLIDLVSQASPNTKRPAATVRQFIRRHQSRGQLHIDQDGYIHWIEQ